MPGLALPCRAPTLTHLLMRADDSPDCEWPHSRVMATPTNYNTASTARAHPASSPRGHPDAHRSRRAEKAKANLRSLTRRWQAERQLEGFHPSRWGEPASAQPARTCLYNHIVQPSSARGEGGSGGSSGEVQCTKLYEEWAAFPFEGYCTDVFGGLRRRRTSFLIPSLSGWEGGLD